MIFEGRKKKDLKQKVAQKNMWVVSLYTLFNESLFFFFWLKNVLRDGWVWFCYSAAPKRSKIHYQCHIYFFSQIYIAQYVLTGFAYMLIPVGFRRISMSFLSFLSQKTYPLEFLTTEVILSRIYLRKCSIQLPIFIAEVVRETYSFIKIMQPISPNYN